MLRMANTIDLEPTSDEPLDDLRCPHCGQAFAGYIEHCPDDGTKLVDDSLLGATIDGRYRIRRRLGDGAMGIVYEAVQLSVDRAVAIKVIREAHHVDRSAAAKRFLREAQLITGINHPNVVHVFDYGQTDDGAPFLVMELLVGRTLAEVLSAAGRLDARRACEVGIQLCDALAAAHARGIVHRDLKPANVMLLDAPAVRDLVKVLDFGLAKSLSSESSPATTLTEAGALLGTPLYMAPEAMGGTVDQRSDLYSLGCMLYELVAGHTPFSDTSINLVITRQLTEAPPPLPADVPAAFADVVMALLAKSPDARPASAASVHAWLQAIVDAPANPERELEDAPTLIHQPRIDQRVTIREIPPPSRRPHIPRAFPVLLVFLCLSLLAFAAVLATR
jgi:serine/threonine-protein kinase